MFIPKIQVAVEDYLREDFSPEQVTGLMRRWSEDTVNPEGIHASACI